MCAGIGARVVQGTIRDSLHMIDVWFNHDGGQRPDIIVTDDSSYVVTWTLLVPHAPLGTGFGLFSS
jgi:hypothetical protein